MDAAARLQIAPATNLFTLTASEAALKKKSNNPDQNVARAMMMESMARAESGGLSPGQAVGQTAFVNFAGQMIANGNSGFMGTE